MKKFYQSSSGRSTPDSGASTPDSKRKMQDFQQEKLSEGEINPAFSSSLETIDIRPYRTHPGLEVITEEETTDTHSTDSTMLEGPPPPYNVYAPPPSDVDRQAYEDFMLSNIKHGDDMCTDPGCPYNRWLYSQASFPASRYVVEWEQDRTRRHFDRLEEIILSPSKMAAANSSRSSTEAKDESESNGSYPVVTLPKSIRHEDTSHVKSSLCCLSSHKSGADRSRLLAEEGYYQPTTLQHKQPLPPPYSEVPGTELQSLDVEGHPSSLSRPSTPSSCSTCPSSKSSCSCCEGSEPVDPTAPHAFTMDPGRGKRAVKGPPKKKRGAAVCMPRCNVVCCASLTFMSFCVIGLAILLLYMKFNTNAMNEGMTAM